MAKPKNNRRRHYSRMDAIELHVAANKSDPFAAKRIAMTLAKHPKEIKHVAEEGQRLCAARGARIVRRGIADWVSDEQLVALSDLRSGLREIKAHRQRKYKKPLTMSMFVSKADLEAARAA